MLWGDFQCEKPYCGALFFFFENPYRVGELFKKKKIDHQNWLAQGNIGWSHTAKTRREDVLANCKALGGSLSLHRARPRKKGGHILRAIPADRESRISRGRGGFHRFLLRP